MTDSDDIIVLTPDEPDDFSDTAPLAMHARRPLWPFFLGGGLLLGFVIAMGVSWYLRPADMNIAPLEAEIETLRTELASLQTQEPVAAPTVDLGPVTRRIAALEARPVVDPLNEEIVARLEALQADGFEIPDMPEMPDIDALNTRIAALETLVATLDARISAGSPTVAVSDIAAIDPDSLPRFPADRLREGAQQLSGSGFFRRTFSRHVRLKGSNDPETLIAGIETDLANGKAQAALNKFDRLPPRLQSLARGWRADMEDALP
ncbi:hypothetical protein ACFFUB_03550 [Algimonas porphyrae]|uniref:Uncharacterized protein n=1 Tax=Algimonas porphyrae TaxID=1128113 RepID=A0ABQ5V0G0_9PROT|nr:hypothetical protein [Algimonas porphyrae]GLQ20159.1 hypothetical protein GCM10007854_11140 [Algimonas porphyrae]